ncbi:MAG: NADH-quinone oxidoreductase subunit N [Spirosomataceae bacterium]
MQAILDHIIRSLPYFQTEWALFVAICVYTLLIVSRSGWMEKKEQPFLILLTSLLLIGLYIWLDYLKSPEKVVFFQGLFVWEPSVLVFKKALVLGALAILVHLYVMRYALVGEFFVLYLGALTGLFLLTMANHWLSLYVTLEFVSITSYLLVALFRQKQQVEAAIKYVLVGTLSSAIMLFGISFLYGLTGQLTFDALAQGLAAVPNPDWVGQVAFFMALAGLFFKLSAVPFHTYTPDVYEAAPTPVVSFLAILPKLSSILVLHRIVSIVNGPIPILLGAIVLLSWLIGNFSALAQQNTKRLLGYSAIAQSGFILVALTARQSEAAFQALQFYVFTYGIISIAAFVLIDIMARYQNSYQLDAIQGLGAHQKLLGFLAVMIAVALVGLPPTVGFTGKLVVFSALWNEYVVTQDKSFLVLVLVGLLNAVVSLFYYLKIPYFLLVSEKENADKSLPSSLQLAQAFCLVLTLLVMGLFFAPQWVSQWLGY